MDELSMLTEQAAIAAKVVAGVHRGDLDKSTPCPGFDVRALINHMCMGNHFLAQAVDGEKVLPDYERDFVADDHAAAYQRSRDDMVRAFSAPGALERTVHFPVGEVPAATFGLGFGLMEAVVHRWDLARAVALDPDIDPAAAALVLEKLRPLIPDEMRASAPDLTTASIPFGPAVEVPETASPVARLVAFLGRTP